MRTLYRCGKRHAGSAKGRDPRHWQQRRRCGGNILKGTRSHYCQKRFLQKFQYASSHRDISCNPI